MLNRVPEFVEMLVDRRLPENELDSHRRGRDHDD